MPTARALELAEPIADILARVRRVVSTADPFEAATSTRRFTIGTPDAVAAVLLPRLLDAIRVAAHGVNIAVRQILPPQGAGNNEQAWAPALDDLEARTVDIAILPFGDIPARFVAHTLYVEEFVLAMRADDPLANAPSLESLCRAQHLVVSLTGNAHGFVDDLLAAQGLSRRVALTVPNFMMALALIAETGLIAALPRHLVGHHAERFGLVCVEPPLPLRRDPIRAIATRAAMMDAGVAWLFAILQGIGREIDAGDQRSESPVAKHRKS